VFGWLRPTCPIDLGAKRWTEDRVGWLLGQFGRERLQHSNVIVPTKVFFPDDYDQSEAAARALFNRTCGFMGTDPASIELVFYQPTHRPGLTRSMVRSRLEWAGQFETGEERNVVRVDVTLLPQPESLLAVFAHELAHQLLLGSKRICRDDPDHEFVTDLTTVFFGMGVFNANDSLVNHYRLNRRGDEIGALGYLTPEIWGYSLALCAWLRNEDEPAWAGWLRPEMRKNFRRSLAYLVRTGDAPVVDGGELDVDGRVSALKVVYPGLALADTISSGATDSEDDECDEETDAATDCEESTDVDETRAESDELLLVASGYIEAGDWNKAHECLSEAIRLDSENGTAYQQRALVLLELGLFVEALQDAEAAVHLEPDDSDAYRARGAAYIKVGQFEQAIVDLTRYVHEEDTNVASGARPSRGYYLRGLAHAGLGNVQQAIKDYTRAIRCWPDWPEPYEARAQAYELVGKSSLARADHDQARRRAMP
jgi:Flp pilus assembly protein TadD